jgi:hypothetical protein
VVSESSSVTVATSSLTPEIMQQMIITALSALGLQGNTSNSQLWLVDFAVSNHMTNSSSMLKNVREKRVSQ